MSAKPEPETPLLQVTDLHKTFVIKRGFPRARTTSVHAVAGVSFTVQRGEVFGIVGESGCGKSTVGRCLLQLIEPTDGIVKFEGTDLVLASKQTLTPLRARMQIIFQDPYSSLNPRRSIGKALAEPLLVHGICSRQDIDRRVDRVLDEVGLPSEAKFRFPHEFSGGQRQRIAIARALIFEPDFIVADEPVSALDVSVQSQILLLLNDLKQRRDLSFVFISHDLGVVRYFCTRVAVMYLGRIVEVGPVPEIFDDPLHPYTQMLRDAAPIPDPDKKVAFARIDGEVPSPSNPPSGCHFHPRCPKAMDTCRRIAPEWTQVDTQRGVACHLFGDDNADGGGRAASD